MKIKKIALGILLTSFITSHPVRAMETTITNVASRGAAGVLAFAITALGTGHGYQVGRELYADYRSVFNYWGYNGISPIVGITVNAALVIVITGFGSWMAWEKTIQGR
jgi:hypothetical protein